MFSSQMRVKCRLVGIDLVKQHAVALAFGLQNIKLQASRLVSDGSIRIGIDQARGIPVARPV